MEYGNKFFIKDYARRGDLERLKAFVHKICPGKSDYMYDLGFIKDMEAFAMYFVANVFEELTF